MGPNKGKTKEEQRFADWIHDQPCMCCLVKGLGKRPAEQHHITEGGRRKGEFWSLPLCEWHHRGIPLVAGSKKMTDNYMGPSLAESKKRFIETFGTELELVSVVWLMWEKFNEAS